MTGPAANAAPDDRLPSVLRFATELVAWVATPWWLAGTSWWLAAGSLVVLVVAPGVLGTPGDKGGKGEAGGADGRRGAPPVAVPGWVTVAMVLLELGAAVVSSWALWPAWAAVCVCVLAAAALVTEQPRRRWLLRRR